MPSNLNNLNSKADKLHVNNLDSVLVDLSKLSDVVENDIAKKDVYNAKIKNIEDKIPDVTKLATNTTLDTVENEMPNICNLVNLKNL